MIKTTILLSCIIIVAQSCASKKHINDLKQSASLHGEIFEQIISDNIEDKCSLTIEIISTHTHFDLPKTKISYQSYLDKSIRGEVENMWTGMHGQKGVYIINDIPEGYYEIQFKCNEYYPFTIYNLFLAKGKNSYIKAGLRPLIE